MYEDIFNIGDHRTIHGEWKGIEFVKMIKYRLQNIDDFKGNG